MANGLKFLPSAGGEGAAPHKKRAPLLGAQRGILYSDKKTLICTARHGISVTQVTVVHVPPHASGQGANHGNYAVGICLSHRSVWWSRRDSGHIG
jgi:hypothetical protein